MTFQITRAARASSSYPQRSGYWAPTEHFCDQHQEQGLARAIQAAPTHHQFLAFLHVHHFRGDPGIDVVELSIAARVR